MNWKWKNKRLIFIKYEKIIDEFVLEKWNKTMEHFIDHSLHLFSKCHRIFYRIYWILCEKLFVSASANWIRSHLWKICDMKNNNNASTSTKRPKPERLQSIASHACFIYKPPAIKVNVACCLTRSPAPHAIVYTI